MLNSLCSTVEKLGRGRWFWNKESRNGFQSNPLEDGQEQEQSWKDVRKRMCIYIYMYKWSIDTYSNIKRMGELTQQLLVQFITYSTMNNLNR